MSRPPVPASRRHVVPYWVKMAVSTLVLGTVTVAFVLVVLPRRFVLQGDLRASDISFPTTRIPFEPGEVTMRPPRPVPVAATVPMPGPAERLWEDVLPLLAAEEYDRALPLFGEYLAKYPSDTAVRQEWAITLIRAGRTDEAEAALRVLVRDTENGRARIELARLLIARGAVQEAAQVVGSIPAGAAEAAEIVAVMDEIHAAAAPPDTAEVTQSPEAEAEWVEVPEATPDTVNVVQQARVALAEGDLDRARVMFEAAVAEHADDPALLREWADALQYRIEDFPAALDALRQKEELAGLTTEERFRKAQLLVWAEEEPEAEGELLSVVSSDSTHAGAWALLGDLRRWDGRRLASSAAYDRALALDPTEPVALAGAELLAEDTRRAITTVDSRELGPTLSVFSDSDGFERAEARAYASLLPLQEVVEVEVGVHRLEGLDGFGDPDSDNGAFVEATAAYWWREGQLRGSVTLGAEDSALGGPEAIYGLRLRALDFAGWNLDASFRSAPAHRLTFTLESVATGLRTDQLSLGFYRGLPAKLELSGALEGASFATTGVDVMRVGAGAALTRNVGAWLRTGLTSRYIRYSGAAPVSTHRPLFWDPKLFWSTGTLFEIHTPVPTSNVGISAYLRATPGLALTRERRALKAQWVPQFEAQAGVRVRRGPLAVIVDGFYTQGREGGYTSRGLTLGLEMVR